MINNSIYYSPTKVYFGEDQENNIGKIIDEYGYKNILIVYGKNSVVKSGLLEKITKQLNVSYHLRGGVEPNPKISFVLETNEKFKDVNIDLILAIGGGSVIDTAKAISATKLENINPLDILQRKVEPTKFIDVATVLTLSAAGSELSSSCVLSDLELKIKRGFNNNKIRPVFSILNPKLTYTVSKYQTANGIVDIMMHTLERFFNPKYTIQFTSEVAIGILKTVVDNGMIAINNPCDYEARANLMLAGS
ncbi:MAG: iron-containing alcohol dehydrogenase, partial [bacterium]